MSAMSVSDFLMMDGKQGSTKDPTRSQVPYFINSVNIFKKAKTLTDSTGERLAGKVLPVFALPTTGGKRQDCVLNCGDGQHCNCDGVDCDADCKHCNCDHANNDCDDCNDDSVRVGLNPLMPMNAYTGPTPIQKRWGLRRVAHCLAGS